MTEKNIGSKFSCGVFTILIICSYYFQLHINTSTSMPLGIYRTVSQPIVSNSLVAVCLPQSITRLGKQRGYLASGNCPGNAEPVLKQVIAVAGDEIQITTQGVWINNRLLLHSKVLTQDEYERPLISQTLNLRKKLTANQIWLYGTASAKSWDSRYYGPISTAAVRAVVIPVWIWSKN